MAPYKLTQVAIYELGGGAVDLLKLLRSYLSHGLLCNECYHAKVYIQN